MRAESILLSGIFLNFSTVDVQCQRGAGPEALHSQSKQPNENASVRPDRAQITQFWLFHLSLQCVEKADDLLSAHFRLCLLLFLALKEHL